MRYVTNDDLVSRTHFARFLIDAGYAKDARGRLRPLPHTRQARPRRARVGVAVAGGGLDSRRGRPGRSSPTRAAIG
jgi:hypothetical protein